jgi:hypothetical protein
MSRKDEMSLRGACVIQEMLVSHLTMVYVFFA